AVQEGLQEGKAERANKEESGEGAEAAPRRERKMRARKTGEAVADVENDREETASPDDEE
ncbi:MAG: 30S ribosomal protein S2, partial [Tannerella sp.]|nr:30S ribosomal protein S2 [Tannerella sp.]